MCRDELERIHRLKIVRVAYADLERAALKPDRHYPVMARRLFRNVLKGRMVDGSRRKNAVWQAIMLRNDFHYLFG